MLAPSLFNEKLSLFDRFDYDPWFSLDDKELKRMEKKLYGNKGKNIMCTDIKENDEEYEIIIDLPGFMKDEVKISLENEYLTICASKHLEHDEVKNEEEEKRGNFIRKERYCGKCKRSFYVGSDMNSSEISAKFENGILRLFVPKKENHHIESNKYIPIED